MCQWPKTIRLPIGTAGLVRGIVRDESGVPLSGITVFLMKANSKVQLGAMRHTSADKSGGFVFDNVSWGKYKLYAMDAERGYPDTSFAFYSQGHYVKVETSPSSPVVSATLQLGPKAGIFEGKVVDAVTKDPVNPTFLLTDFNDPSRWISTSVASNFSVLVPSATSINVKVSAPGYKAWYYNSGSEASKATALRLNAGEELRMTIELSPEETKPSGASPHGSQR